MSLKPFRSVKTKIAAGYLLLVILSIFAVGYTYREMKRLSAPDDYEAELARRRTLINRVLYDLYQAESYGQLLAAGYVSDGALYRRGMGEVRADLDSLRAFVRDSVQLERIDSVDRLLRSKQRTILDLRQAVREAGTEELFRKNIEQEVIRRDTVVMLPTVRESVTVRQDTLRIKKERKGFFRRLGDLFSPEPADSQTVVQSVREIRRDTAQQAYNTADTIVTVLRNIQSDVNSEKQALYDRIQERSRVLRYNNQVLTSQINRLLRELEQEETGRLLERIGRRQDAERRSARTVGRIALGAVGLALLFLFFIWRDIARSNRYRRELEAAKKRAEDLLDVREKLMLTITHDIKAPLGAVLGYADLLAPLLTDRRQREYLARIGASSDHLLRLVNDLLDFHRLEAGKMDVQEEPFDPRKLFEDIVGVFEPQAVRKGLALALNADGELPVRVTGDAVRIRQILSNLLSNAIKFTDRGSVAVDVSVRGTTEAGRKALRFAVADTGKGIGDEERERIFREFVRLPSAQGIEGFGLGLSIARRLVGLLGGTMALQSRPGAGSRFEVSLPVRIVREGLPEANSGREAVPVWGRPVRCLLVDDDRLQLDLTAAMLRRLGATADTCLHPKQVVALLGRKRYDMVFTDLQMPELDGFGLVSRIRGTVRYRNLPVVALTARSDHDEAALIAHGFSARLNKPFSLAELAACIRRVLEPGREPDDGTCSVTGGSGEGPETEEMRNFAGVRDGVCPDGIPAGCGEAEEGTPRFEALTAFAADDPEAAAAILESFVTETGKNLASLAQAAERGDAAGAAAVAHRMLPVFRMLTCSDIVEALAVLEGSRDRDFDDRLRETALRARREAEAVLEAARRKSGPGEAGQE